MKTVHTLQNSGYIGKQCKLIHCPWLEIGPIERLLSAYYVSLGLCISDLAGDRPEGVFPTEYVSNSKLLMDFECLGIKDNLFC